MHHGIQYYLLLITVTRFTRRNYSVQKCINTSTIFDNIMSADRFVRLQLMKKDDILIFHMGWLV